MKKKILLVWDIWTWKNWWYHIGDESMFFYNFTALSQQGNYDIYATSRGISHDYIPQTKELYRIYFSNGFLWRLKLFFFIAFQSLFTKRSKISNIIETIKYMDSIIISWWWNLNSIRSWHLYFRFLIAYFARKYKKKLYISAQTVGPLYNFIDRYLVRKIYAWAKCFAVRDKTFSVRYLTPYTSKIKTCYDDSFQKQDSIYSIKKDKSTRYIWWSIHQDFSRHNTIKLKNIINIINSFYQNNTEKHYMLPHLFDNQDRIDIDFMKQIKHDWDYILNYVALTSKQKESWFRFEHIIESYTGSMDLIITTRYHAAVFAVKNWRIPIMIYRNTYEKEKFIWLLDTVWLSLHEHLLFDIYDTDTSIKKKSLYIKENQQKLKNQIRKSVQSINYNNIFINYFIIHDQHITP